MPKKGGGGKRVLLKKLALQQIGKQWTNTDTAGTLCCGIGLGRVGVNGCQKGKGEGGGKGVEFVEMTDKSADTEETICSWVVNTLGPIVCHILVIFAPKLVKL